MDTAARTRDALRGYGLRVVDLAVLRDVDVAGDAYAVADRCAAGSRFRRAVAELLPAVAP